MAEERTERFSTWSGRVSGVVGLVVVAAVVVVGVAGVTGDDGYHPAVYPACAVAAVLLWIVLLRPEVRIAGDRLVLRNMLETVRIPLAAIERVAVRQFLAVRVADKRYTSTGMNRSKRQGRRDDRRPEDLAQVSFGGFVEARIEGLARDAREARGVEHLSDEQAALTAEVRREPAWVEIGLLAVSVVAFVVTLLL